MYVCVHMFFTTLLVRRALLMAANLFSLNVFFCSCLGVVRAGVCTCMRVMCACENLSGGGLLLIGVMYYFHSVAVVASVYIYNLFIFIFLTQVLAE